MSWYSSEDDDDDDYMDNELESSTVHPGSSSPRTTGPGTGVKDNVVGRQGRDAVSCTTVQTLTFDVVQSEMWKTVQSFRDLTHVSTAAAVILLRHCNWHGDNAMESYYSGDSDQLLESLNLSQEIIFNDNHLERNTSEETCLACMEELAPGNGLCFSTCKHYFCFDCWVDSILYKVRGALDLLDVRCQMDGCNELIALSQMTEVFGSTDAQKEIVDRAYLNSFMSASTRYKFCANPQSCHNTILFVPYAYTLSDIRCGKCSYFFCMNCGLPAHAPATCRDMERWIACVKADSASAACVLEISKPCPGCKTRIQKTVGCHHMTCFLCTHQFCWVCLAPWTANSYNTHAYNCRGDGRDAKMTESNDSKDFLENYTNYDKHLNAKKRVIDKFKQLRSSNGFTFVSMPTANSDFVIHLIHNMELVYSDACQVLAHCYVHTFCASVEGVKDLPVFFDRRRHLEEATNSIAMSVGEITKYPLNETIVARIRGEVDAVNKWIQVICSI